MAQQRLELTWYNKDLALIPTQHGRYGYSWVSSDDPRYCETRSLIMDEYVHGTQSAKSDDFTYSERADLPPSDDNLLILGESGDVLEALVRTPELRDKYAGKVKCIYIDPPFNTSQTFEHYEDNLEHSIWLTMMRDRLVNMKKLLSADGSIWVHLDEAESHRMRVLLDEVFGAGNFVADIAWQKTYSPDNRASFTQMHDSILVYASTNLPFKEHRNLLPRSAKQNAAYVNPDRDPRGRWKPGDFTAQLNILENPREDQRYTLVSPSGLRFEPPAGRCWVYTQDRYEELLADDRVWFGPDGNGRPAAKRFLSEVMDGRVPSSWWTYEEVGHTQDAKRETQAVVPHSTPFDTPKPERLLERVVHIATNPGDIVLDCFAGSGTTAAVAQKMGRRWITCELIEETFTKFTRPRLEKVVNDSDPGGITKSKGQRVADVELPQDVDLDDAYRNTTAIRQIKTSVDLPVELASLTQKAVRRDSKTDTPALGDDERRELLRLLKKFGTSTEATIDVLPDVAKKVNAALKTKKAKDETTWRGGGGFHIAHLSPACFDYNTDLGLVTLTEAANDHATLASNVAAHLGFYRSMGTNYFDGQLGTMQLLVTRNTVTDTMIEAAVANLDEGHRVTIAATSVADGAAQELRRRSSGSRIIHILNDLFPVRKEINS